MTTPLNNMAVIVPTRGRPGNLRDLREAFVHSQRSNQVSLFAACDQSDPMLPEYDTMNGDDLTIFDAPTITMNEALNHMAHYLAWGCRYIGFMGDDHRPRTPGWDERIMGMLDELRTGIVYGNDLFQGPNLPTAVFMTSDIVRALGYMAPPCLEHLELDSYWLALGLGADCLRYLPTVVIEHMHPEAGKSEYDDGYARVNTKRERDKAAWEAFKVSGEMERDIEKVRALR